MLVDEADKILETSFDGMFFGMYGSRSGGRDESEKGQVNSIGSREVQGRTQSCARRLPDCAAVDVLSRRLGHERPTYRRSRKGERS